MGTTPRPMTDGDRLATLAAWLDHASRWLEREVRDSRAARPADDDDGADPGQRVEAVTFLSAELDAMVDGLRRAADVLAALAAPPPGPIVPVCGLPPPTRPKPRPANLRLVE